MATDISADFQNVISAAEKLKKVMVKKNLSRAKAKCPMCDGFLHGVLSNSLSRSRSSRQHFAMSCDVTCKAWMME
jgi:hypothetical protein